MAWDLLKTQPTADLTALKTDAHGTLFPSASARANQDQLNAEDVGKQVGTLWESRGKNVTGRQVSTPLSLSPSLDTEGNTINAHGAGFLFYAGKYYMYGERKVGATQGTDITSYNLPAKGISCYSSYDLINWTYERLALPEGITDPATSDYINAIVERPKVVYNEKNNNFVMFIHVDSANYAFAQIGIAVSNSPIGPFSYLGSSQPVFPSTCRDLTVFVDDDKKAYVYVTRNNNADVVVHELNADYTGFTANYATALSAQNREAPCVVKYNNKYWLITSGEDYWNPTAARIAVSDTVLGTYSDLGTLCQNDTNGNSYGTQVNYIIPVQSQSFGCQFIMCFDGWVPQNLESSTYLWLPLLWDGTKFYVDINNGLLTTNKYLFDFRIEDSENPLNGLSIADALKIIADHIGDLGLPVNYGLTTEGMILNFDGRDYTAGQATWAPRVGTGAITFQDPTKASRNKNSVHVLEGGAGISNIQPFINGDLSEYTVEILAIPFSFAEAGTASSYVECAGMTDPWYGFAFQKADDAWKLKVFNNSQTGFCEYDDTDVQSKLMIIKIVHSSTEEKIYVNNVLVRTSPVSFNIAQTGDQHLTIGCNGAGGSYAEVEVASIRIYNRALGSGELLNNYNYDVQNYVNV